MKIAWGLLAVSLMIGCQDGNKAIDMVKDRPKGGNPLGQGPMKTVSIVLSQPPVLWHRKLPTLDEAFAKLGPSDSLTVTLVLPAEFPKAIWVEALAEVKSGSLTIVANNGRVVILANRRAEVLSDTGKVLIEGTHGVDTQPIHLLAARRLKATVGAIGGYEDEHGEIIKKWYQLDRELSCTITGDQSIVTFEVTTSSDYRGNCWDWMQPYLE